MLFSLRLKNRVKENYAVYEFGFAPMIPGDRGLTNDASASDLTGTSATRMIGGRSRDWWRSILLSHMGLP